jgi:ketosteroid isomerase-like protein
MAVLEHDKDAMIHGTEGLNQIVEILTGSFFMENQTQTVVQQFLQFLTQRNLAELTNLFSEHIDWYIPGDEQKVEWLGRRENKKQVQDFYETLWSRTEPVSAKIDDLFFKENNAVITGEFSTKMLKTNKIVHSLFCIQITVENNLIVKYRLLEDSYAVSLSMSESL